MADSILTSVKKIVGITELDTSFDPDIIMHTKTVFAVLNQLGIGPNDGFVIEDTTPTWGDFLAGDNRLNMVKTYLYLRVRLLFDPPQTSFGIESLNKQIEELEVRMSIVREEDAWIDSNPMAETATSSTTWWE